MVVVQLARLWEFLPSWDVDNNTSVNLHPQTSIVRSLRSRMLSRAESRCSDD